MLDYMLDNYEKLMGMVWQHLGLVIISLCSAILIVSILVVVCMYLKKFEKILLTILSIMYTIPSVSLLVILIPVTGLGFKTAIITLILYNLYLLATNILNGFHSIDSMILESAIAMGMKPYQVLLCIQIPLAKSAILTGIRLSIVSTIQVATIAAIINAGGLGTLLFDGLRTMNMIKICWGAILSALLAIGFNYLFLYFEKKIGSD